MTTMTTTSPVLLLSRREVAALLSIGDVVDALEAAFRAQARGAALGPVSSRLPAGEGSAGAFHAKGGGLERGGASYAAFKVNGNFPENPRRHGLPTIQGLIVLADAVRGTPLAVMDSIEITALRTAAATAVAARRLAPPNARRATIAGCGVQGWSHARALRHVLPELELLLHDRDTERSADLAARVRSELGGAARSALELEAAARASEIVVTCTTARAPVLRSAWISPGALVAAVGADSPGKQELDADLVARARVVVDDLDACAAGGELQHALRAGLMSREDVAARLAEVVAGSATVRRVEHDVVVFDSTGIALEDVAAAALAYERALERGVGTRWHHDSP
jgi:ornithine cyclodeaminase/alanine dehydrogenase-like protein (mu-crystallin family)